MNEVNILDLEENTLWQKMHLKVNTQRIIYWVLIGISSIGILLLSFSVTLLPFYFFYIGLSIGLGFSITSVILNIFTNLFYGNLLLIDSIRNGRKIEQLIYISQKNSFQDRRGFGRKILAIAALADLAPKEAIEPLSFMVQDPSCKHKQLVTQALAEINRKITFYTDKGIPSKAQLDPYKDREGNYISLFELEKSTIKFTISNSLASLFIFVFIFVLILTQYGLLSGAVDFTNPTILIVFMGLMLIIIEYVIIISVTFVRINKIKQYIEQKNFYDLITLINKSNFGFLRATKGIGISALGDIGAPESISSLITMAQTSKPIIQNKAVVALDLISVKNGIDKRYVLQVH
ncbi:MAG TPA: hypothetical protein VMZ29_02715 [Candidatus Bathyarchaeia archaeon]|nr:hypothetical protein [Candidatus Bathyarchaeia archaeon]